MNKIEDWYERNCVKKAYDDFVYCIENKFIWSIEINNDEDLSAYEGEFKKLKTNRYNIWF